MWPRIGRRIVVLGHACSGKSTLARILAQRLQIEYVDVDKIHWLPGGNWQERDMEEKRRLVREVASAQEWIFDGFSKFMKPSLLPRTECAIWLDISPTLLLPRLVLRTLRRWAKREKVCGDNYESPHHLFGKGSLLLYLWRTRHTNTAKFRSAMDEFRLQGAKTIRFESTREAIRWAREQMDQSASQN